MLLLTVRTLPAETCDVQARARAGAALPKPDAQAGLQPAGQALQGALHQPQPRAGLRGLAHAETRLRVAEADLRVHAEASLPLHAQGKKQAGRLRIIAHNALFQANEVIQEYRHVVYCLRKSQA